MMTSGEIQTASRPTLLRLPLYHRVLKGFAEAGQQHVSCTQIAGVLRLDPTQVRKDLSVTSIVGKPKVGYEVPALIDAIEDYLGWKNTTEAFLVGAGSLGTALLGYKGFKEYGLDIVAAFDSAPEKIGLQVHGKEVLPLDRLPDLAERLHILIGVMTVSAQAAQDVANLMVLSGIRAIWNFTPVRLEVPEGVIVENVQLSASLSVLSRKLAEALEKNT